MKKLIVVFLFIAPVLNPRAQTFSTGTVEGEVPQIMVPGQSAYSEKPAPGSDRKLLSTPLIASVDDVFGGAGNDSHHRQLTDLLHPDGTVDLSTGYSGSLNAEGFHMVTGQGGEPVFLPATGLDGKGDGDDDYWDRAFGAAGLDGDVRALYVSGDHLYAGGDFTTAGGVTVNHIARWDGTSWSPLGDGLSEGGGLVSAIVKMGDDLYAGGQFNKAGGVDARYIARWDGTSWSAVGSGNFNDYVYALSVIDGNLFAGGGFTNVGAVDVNHIAKWDGNNWSALGTGVDLAVIALAVMGNDLYAAGHFETAGGTSANHIAKWDGASWSSLGTGMDGIVETISVNGDDLYAGGQFTTAGGVTVNRIARWNGTSWSALGAGVNSHVSAIAFMANDVYVGGIFSTAGGTPVNRIARWNGSTWHAVGEGVDDSVYELAVIGNDLYIGGKFTGSGALTIEHIARWDGSNYITLGAGLETQVQAVAVMGSDLYAGGFFDIAGGVTVNKVAKWDGNSWSSLGTGMNGNVYALAVSGNSLYAGGEFTTAGGVTANRIARWDGSSWSALGTGMPNGTVRTIAFMGNDLYAGGSFTDAGGTSANRIAKWDGTSWSALGSGVGASVNALAVSGNSLYAGGLFTTAGGVTVNRIARWDGTSWSALGDGLGSAVHALGVLGNELYAGGQFTTAGGIGANRIARWDGTSWSALDDGLDNWVYALAVSGNVVYAGGAFQDADGETANYIAQWDGTSWSALGTGMNASIVDFAVTGNSLYSGGNFITAGGSPSHYIGRWFKPVADAAVTRTFTTPQAVVLKFNETADITGVGMKITTNSGGPTVHVLRFADAPEDPDGITDNVSAYRWIIHQTGLAHGFNAEVRFSLSDIPDHGITKPDVVTVYKRVTPGSGLFSPLTTTYDSTKDEIVAEGVSSFGEFAFGIKQTHQLTFNVDMQSAAPFDPGGDVVYVTGSMFGWTVPGGQHEDQVLGRVDDSMVWSKTIEAEEGTWEYKYFLNGGWEGGEWDGPPNRSVTVENPVQVYDVWGDINGSFVPGDRQLSAITIQSHHNECYDAFQTITTGGLEGPFEVEPGGEAKLIAGERIIMASGTNIKQGGYLHAYIDDVFCADLLTPKNFVAEEIVNVPSDPVEPPGIDLFFRVYPNPTFATFVIEPAAVKEGTDVRIDIHNLLGRLILSKQMPAQSAYVLSLSGQPPGMYIVRITKSNKAGIARIIKK